MKVSLATPRKGKKDISDAWVDPYILETASTFDYEGGLNCAFRDVGPYSDYEVLTPNKDKGYVVNITLASPPPPL